MLLFFLAKLVSYGNVEFIRFGRIVDFLDFQILLYLKELYRKTVLIREDIMVEWMLIFVWGLVF